MSSERIQRQIDRLRLDAENEDAQNSLAAARDVLGVSDVAGAPQPAPAPVDLPSPFAGGRYEVRGLIGEGGKKRVFLARDSRCCGGA